MIAFDSRVLTQDQWDSMEADCAASVAGLMASPASPPAYVVRPLRVGAKGADTTMVLTAGPLADIVANGGEYVGRYLSSISTAEIARIHATKIITGPGCLGLITFTYSRPDKWIPSQALGLADGKRDVALLRALGLPSAHPHIFDLEGCRGPASATDDHVSAWASVLIGGGYINPGLYVGAAPGGCSSDQLYAIHGVNHYMRSCSIVPDVARRGYRYEQFYRPNQSLPHTIVDWGAAHDDWFGCSALATFAA